MPCLVLSCLVLLCRLCVCCHSIVGLVWRLCGRVVSLWNSGGDLCWVEGRVVFIVRCQLVCCGVCFSVVCAGCVVSSFVFPVFSFSFSSVSLVGGVRGSARAAMRARTLSPNTIVSVLLCSFFPSLSLPAFPFVGMAVCVFTMCRCA